MPDLIMLHQDRLVEFLREGGPKLTREIADHFDWSIDHTREELERLQRRRLVQASQPMSDPNRRGMTHRWSVIT